MWWSVGRWVVVVVFVRMINPSRAHYGKYAATRRRNRMDRDALIKFYDGTDRLQKHSYTYTHTHTHARRSRKRFYHSEGLSVILYCTTKRIKMITRHSCTCLSYAMRETVDANRRTIHDLSYISTLHSHAHHALQTNILICILLLARRKIHFTTVHDTLHKTLKETFETRNWREKKTITTATDRRRDARKKYFNTTVWSNGRQVDS